MANPRQAKKRVPPDIIRILTVLAISHQADSQREAETQKGSRIGQQTHSGELG